MDDWKDIRTWSREEMMKRVARFKALKGSDGGLPDSKLPECRRKLYAVIGFQPPMSDSAAVTSPVGDDASAMPAIPIAEGFNLGYCKAKPGKGPLMHNHDTNETFIAMTGKWRCEWNEGEAMEYVDLDKQSIPPNAVTLIPDDLMRKHLILPLGNENGKIRVALHDPLDMELQDVLRFRLGKDIRPVITMVGGRIVYDAGSANSTR